MSKHSQQQKSSAPRHPGQARTIDGGAAVVAVERAASDAAAAYPGVPAAQMGQAWAEAVAAGETNLRGRPLSFFEAESEIAAAAISAGLSMTGLRATAFSAGQGLAAMHESLFAAAGKRLPFVLHVACRALTKQAQSVHTGHDDYHAVDDSGLFQLFASDVQGACDLALIARRIAELALGPGLCAQDGHLTSHTLETIRLPEPELIAEFLGDPADEIDAPTPAQRLVFGDTRRRIPELFDVDHPALIGALQRPDTFQQGVAAQRPFYFDHLAELADRAFDEYAALSGRRYARARGIDVEGADYLVVGQGSVVGDAHACARHLRESRALGVGVVDLTMFRPFPADLLVALLRGRKGVLVLERVDQPLAVDPPIAREIRAALGKALENAASGSAPPHEGLGAIAAAELPALYSGCYGLGGRPLGSGDLVAAIENMLPGAAGKRHFYLGIDFVRPETRLPKLQIWQDRLLEHYPQLGDLALPPAAPVDLRPAGSWTLRIHSIGGWDVVGAGRRIASTVAELGELWVRATPDLGAEKSGQPTTFHLLFAERPSGQRCEHQPVALALVFDPLSFRHGDPAAGIEEGGTLLQQSELEGAELWRSFSAGAQRRIKSRRLRVIALDARQIAGSESDAPASLRRLHSVAFLGALLRHGGLMERKGLDEAALFDAVHARLAAELEGAGEERIEAHLRAFRRGYQEGKELHFEELQSHDPEPAEIPAIPDNLRLSPARSGPADPGRFWEQVGYLHRSGDDPLADPITATAVLPAATSTLRDLSEVRLEVPRFEPARCSGCGECWTQCPDSAIPGVVSSVEQVLEAAIASLEGSFDRLRQIVKHLGRECRKILKGAEAPSFPETLDQAYEKVAEKVAGDAERRAELDQEYGALRAALADFPLARTEPFFVEPEQRSKGSGGLLSVTVDPRTCTGCNLCVEVCPEAALRAVPQTDAELRILRRNWSVWEQLPETDEQYLGGDDRDAGIGVLPTLLLKKSYYHSMLGGDGACMGCGEKTGLHLVLAAVQAVMGPKVAALLREIDELCASLDQKARGLLASDTDLERVAANDSALQIDGDTRARIERILGLIRALEDLKWRYREGPGGRGRAQAAFANASGCSSAWGSTYPFNPYPFPWTHHLLQDAPSIAIGLFEGQMRKMAEGFATLRRARLELDEGYDPHAEEAFFASFDWRQFTDEELALCPPLFAVGGSAAFSDAGLQNLSRLLASGRPIRAVVLDTRAQGESAGAACALGFQGQLSDSATFPGAHRGTEEMHKELALIAMAHRGAFVLQSTQAHAAHLFDGVMHGLESRRPALFLLYAPCPPEHGIGDDSAHRAARLAAESRAFPLLRFDPDRGPALAESLSLDGNPAPDALWPTRELSFVNDRGETETESLPITVADWAATEARFADQFQVVGDDSSGEWIPFHDYLERPPRERVGATPFIRALDDQRHLRRLAVSERIVALGEERRLFWSQLRQMAGIELPDALRARLQDELREQYEQKIAQLRATYPALIATRMAEALIGSAAGRAPTAAAPVDGEALMRAAAAVAAPTPAPVATKAPPAPEEEDDDDFGLDPYIDSIRCTACNECTNLNRKMFVYNDKKQAIIADAGAGSFKDLVSAAEKCPVRIIHPGTPLNPDEPDLEKWIQRAEPFN